MDPRSAPVLLLLLGFLRGIAAGAGGGEVLAAIGSSVLLDPEHGANLSDSQVEWTFTGSDGKLVTILDYVPNSPIQKPNDAFKSRLHFNTTNGLVTLTNLNSSDQGVYTITVGSNWKRSMDLKLIEPMAEPLIKATYVDSTVELICLVAGGKASSILWKKGPDVIKNSQHYQLLQNNSKLTIVKVTETDCGIYTCIVENMFSKNSNAHSLILHDVPLLLNCAKIFSIAALLTAVVPLIYKIIEFFVGLKTRRKQKQGLQLHQNLLQILQFLLLIGAFGFWISTEGVVSSTWCMMFDNRKKFSKTCIAKLGGIVVICLSCSLIVDTVREAAYRLLQIVSVTPVGGIVVICLSCSLIVDTVREAGNRCEPAAKHQSSLIRAWAALLFLLLICIVFYIKGGKWRNWITGNPSASDTGREPDEHRKQLNEPFLKHTDDEPT
ncbi:uncharacterized protein LOC132832463 isoform X2 [Hemiscyllium ocellatum]|uniref:uncharacterized protein LOC132832463 isoform X2 n=1 Tax=Hemiscyllium ocellatum TaxID=170820 RepID=UPI002966F0E2|nr:uncharacterized protein LOC132832463 isoform X2 [Hemiscyllium ocellatum]